MGPGEGPRKGPGKGSGSALLIGPGPDASWAVGATQGGLEHARPVVCSHGGAALHERVQTPPLEGWEVPLDAHSADY